MHHFSGLFRANSIWTRRLFLLPYTDNNSFSLEIFSTSKLFCYKWLELAFEQLNYLSNEHFEQLPIYSPFQNFYDKMLGHSVAFMN